MGKITDRVKKIYKSDKSLNEKITSLAYYARLVGFNEHNFDIFVSEIKQYDWKKDMNDLPEAD